MKRRCCSSSRLVTPAARPRVGGRRHLEEFDVASSARRGAAAARRWLRREAVARRRLAAPRHAWRAAGRAHVPDRRRREMARCPRSGRTCATRCRLLGRSPGFTAIAIADAGARHRRQHRDVRGRQRRAAQAAAVPGRRPADARAPARAGSMSRSGRAAREGVVVPEVPDLRSRCSRSSRTRRSFRGATAVSPATASPSACAARSSPIAYTRRARHRAGASAGRSRSTKRNSAGAAPASR